MRWNYYNLRQLSLLQSAMDCYYKLRQLFFTTNCDTVYYKLRQVLQSAMIITNCDSTKEVCTLEMSCPWIKSRAKKDEEKTLKYGPTMWELKQIQWLQS